VAVFRALFGDHARSITLFLARQGSGRCVLVVWVVLVAGLAFARGLRTCGGCGAGVHLLRQSLPRLPPTSGGWLGALPRAYEAGGHSSSAEAGCYFAAPPVVGHALAHVARARVMSLPLVLCVVCRLLAALPRDVLSAGACCSLASPPGHSVCRFYSCSLSGMCICCVLFCVCGFPRPALHGFPDALA